MCNVLVMGKTGAGKSQLLNYLCDQQVAPTGAGKPVTGEGIYEYEANINGQDVRIFDSWGIEAGKVDRWKNLINQALQEHGVQRDISDWFHSIIYCVQAGGARVEDVDIAITKQLLADGYKLTIVLTKADQVNEETLQTMKQTVQREVCGEDPEKIALLNIIASCSEHKVTRAGEIKPFGKEEISASILDGWRDTILERLPKHVIARLCEYIDEEMETLKEYIFSQSISGRPKDNAELYNYIAQSANQIFPKIGETILPAILKEVEESCRRADMSLSAVLNVQSRGLSAIDTSKDSLTWWQVALMIYPPTTLGMTGYLLGSRFLRAKMNYFIRQERWNLYQRIEQVKEQLIERCKQQEGVIEEQLRLSIK